MTPDDIAQVTRTWQTARADETVLTRVVADRLPGSGPARDVRAAWIVRAVSGLAPVLEHPTAFAPAAADLIARRFPVTLDELAVDRDALLGALAERLGPLEPETAHAWDLAIGLFAEIVGALGLDPFGPAPADPTSPPPEPSP